MPRENVLLKKKRNCGEDNSFLGNCVFEEKQKL